MNIGSRLIFPLLYQNPLRALKLTPAIPPRSFGELPHIIEFLTVGMPKDAYIPPPSQAATLRAIVQ